MPDVGPFHSCLEPRASGAKMPSKEGVVKIINAVLRLLKKRKGRLEGKAMFTTEGMKGLWKAIRVVTIRAVFLLTEWAMRSYGEGS